MKKPSKRALIFGVGGQDGAYLACFLLQKGYEVHGTSRDVEIARLAGLRQLSILDKVILHSANLNDFPGVIQTLRKVAPSEIYNLSAQSSVGLSFDQPIETVNSIVNATLNVLEAIRILEINPRLYNASSSEMFGDADLMPANEMTPFRPHSPYAISKAAAHWLIDCYRKSYGIFACSGILFNHESPLRPERFVTQKIIRAAVDIKLGAKRKLKLGNISVVRDWGWAPDYVQAMWLMLQQQTAEDFVIATGYPATLEDFVRTAFEQVGLDWEKHVDFDHTLFRPYEVERTVGDPSKAQRELGWQANFKMPEVVTQLIKAEMKRRNSKNEDKKH